ncbi:mitochondrial chaperone BCS1 protein [Dioscorea alata]|uniref:Mitochondrial chaperone BCS1 protein n=1 Tax=Dioscorea alata TaxID=55571 RepID=A0ACB7TR32_DIOAL|nr:mitochondrial chaperone BCS1 protein [Dioscorea alata]
MALPDNNKVMRSTKDFLTTAASLAATAVVARTVINDLVPYELRDYILSGINYLRSRSSSHDLIIVIEEKDGYTPNHVYQAAMAYLSSKPSSSMRRIKVRKHDEDKNLVVSLDQGEEMIDVFEGIEFKWCLVCSQQESSNKDNGLGMLAESRSFELSFKKKHKDTALNVYVPWILDWWKAFQDQDKTLKLYMNEGDCWCPINLHHPATFETLAMDPDLKRSVMDDLARFVKRKDYYKRIGKAWKRGYLLYGPPGTGKSSLIAAMANFLKFDIYDLELTEVNWNSSLRRLLMGTSNKSIIVVEDIDCSVQLPNRDTSDNSNDEKVTLSGLLNFVDGLWSSCGEERIIVFTTNYKEKLDLALLRPGRMDMHIHMGYCSPSAFRILASNYHNIDDHPLFEEIETLIKEVEITPAAIAEELMRSDDVDVALQGLVECLQHQKLEVNKPKSGVDDVDKGEVKEVDSTQN